MTTIDAADASWCAIEQAITSLIDLKASAARTGAFRQARGVPSAAALLRLCLTEAVCGLSLRGTCAWALSGGVANLSSVALNKRFRHAGPWLGDIAGTLLAARSALEPRWPGYQVRLIDATTLSEPGASGTSWRLHLCFDLGTARLVEASLTDEHGGESLNRVGPPPPGVIDVGDAGYPHPRPMRAHLAAGGHLIVRTSWASVRLLTPTGQRFDRLGALRRVDGPTGAWDVVVDDRQPGQPPLRLRLIAGRKSPEACEQARRRVRANAKRKGKTPDARSLEAADWILVLTSLPAAEFDAAAVLDIYRLRWQVELAIKRWKSLLGLRDLPMRRRDTATTWIYAMVIAALLIEDKVADAATHFPPEQSGHAPRLLPLAHVRSLGPSPERSRAGTIPLAPA